VLVCRARAQGSASRRIWRSRKKILQNAACVVGHGPHPQSEPALPALQSPLAVWYPRRTQTYDARENRTRAMIIGPEDSQVTMTVELPGGGDVRDVPCFRIRIPPEDGSGKQATLSADLIAGLSAGNVKQVGNSRAVAVVLKMLPPASLR
jgi:hypothetical protein